ncbi:MAG: carboxypeptidase regulatory-like domain-containing protein, partial [Chitinophagaceae bacterium]
MRYLFAIVFSVFFFASCSKSTDSANEPTSGDINGTIQVWDDKLNSLADRSGVTVTLEKADGNLIATTNSNGRYEFKNVPFGEYDLVISKVDYGTMQLFDIRHAKTTTGATTSTITTVPSFSFGQKSTTQITNLSV